MRIRTCRLFVCWHLIFQQFLAEFLILSVCLLLASSARSAEIYPPTLALNWESDGLVLRAIVVPDQEIVTIYQTIDLSIPAQAWMAVRTFPAARSLENSITLSDPARSTTRFFRIGKQALALPNSLVWIPPGDFTMGSADSEAGRYYDEGPQHHVQIQQGFWLNKFEVTQAEYESLMRINPSSNIRDPSCPVDSVTWERANEYCIRLTSQERSAGRLPPGLVYRLPTSAEWEYACRAGTQTRYSFGDDEAELSLYAWWANNGGPAQHPVGTKLPNPWGLYDMHGNVFEWCHDEYLPYPGGRISPGPSRRVLRSGAFYCPSYILRSACRFESAFPTSVSRLVGFRVALAPIEPQGS